MSITKLKWKENCLWYTHIPMLGTAMAIRENVTCPIAFWAATGDWPIFLPSSSASDMPCFNSLKIHESKARWQSSPLQHIFRHDITYCLQKEMETPSYISHKLKPYTLNFTSILFLFKQIQKRQILSGLFKRCVHSKLHNINMKDRTAGKYNE